MGNDSDLKYASWGASIRRISDGSIVAEYDPDRRLIPASIQKLITTSAAMEMLGGDYRLETRLRYSGDLDTVTGVLKGNVLIRGGGDPTLGSGKVGSKTLDELVGDWVDAIRTAGIRRVEGSVIGDARFFEDELAPSTWSWNDLGNYYAAPASGLTIADNHYRLTLTSPAGVGAATSVVRTEPEMGDITFHNEVVTGEYGTGDEAYIHGSPFTYAKFIRGTLPPGRGTFTIKGALPDPALFAADQLRQALIHDGIPVTGQSQTNRTSDLSAMDKVTTIHTELSPRFADIITRINQESDNLYAEHLLKMIGLKKKGHGTTAAGLEALEEHLVAKGQSADAFELADGCGLSRSNTISASAMTGYLATIAQRPGFMDFKSTLAVCGESGTLESICDGTIAQGRIYGKSGSLKGVRSYAGYFTSLSGEEYCFAFMSNYFTGAPSEMKSKWEKVMVEMVRI
jgi:D-alanyl-D-alanine carboxypeptidase/D-alanyl-D-alanine-endopeptidase (penicillin-binding protein 4)